jgi:hypothetical protein
MDPLIQQKLDEQSQKIDKILISVEKTRKYFQLIFWITIVAFILPLLGLLVTDPSLINSYMSTINLS